MTLHLAPVDLAVVVVYLCIPLAVGLAFRARGSRDTESFFLSGRALPWWLAGTSMAAETFASDTPLYVAALVRRDGIAGNWEWWSFAFSGLLGVFVLARLWRRSELTTDVEFVEFRYGGRPAAVLRGLKAFLLAVPFNCLLLGGMPLLGMAKILLVLAGFDAVDPSAPSPEAALAKLVAIVACFGVVLVYSRVSGLWAVVWNDFLLFWIALAGALLLAWHAVDAVGGLAGLREGLAAADAGRATSRTDFLPGPGAAFQAFLVFVGVQWWVHRTADGGGVNIQRMLACRSEGHAVGAMLWFNVLNYAIRTWPWVLTGLAAVILYPTVVDPEAAYPMLIRDVLPAGLRGLLLASLLAAFMTTADTQLNWGASYLVNDIYRRFIRREATQEHYLAAARVAVLALAVVTTLVAFHGATVGGMFRFLISFFAGTGTVFLGRWLWWRVNAWGELAAVLTAPAATLAWQSLTVAGGPLEGVPGHWRVPAIAATTMLCWIAVTLLTPPVAMEHLVAFYRRTRPPGAWGPVRQAAGGEPAPSPLAGDLLRWAAGVAFVLGTMLAAGKALFGAPVEAAALGGAAAAAGAALLLDHLRRRPPTNARG